MICEAVTVEKENTLDKLSIKGSIAIIKNIIMAKRPTYLLILFKIKFIKFPEFNFELILQPFYKHFQELHFLLRVIQIYLLLDTRALFQKQMVYKFLNHFLS